MGGWLSSDSKSKKEVRPSSSSHHHHHSVQSTSQRPSGYQTSSTGVQRPATVTYDQYVASIRDREASRNVVNSSVGVNRTSSSGLQPSRQSSTGLSSSTSTRAQTTPRRPIEEHFAGLYINNTPRSVNNSSSNANETVLESIISPKRSLKTNLGSVDVSTVMEFSQPTGRFVTTYVAAVINNEKAILMIPADDGNNIKEVTIRMTNNTEVGDSGLSIKLSSLFISQKIRVYEVISTMETDEKLPTWSASRWIATKIMPSGPLPPTIKTIGFAYDELCIGRFPIISDETPSGFMVNRSKFAVDDDKNFQQIPTLGSMYMVNAYKLRRGTTVTKMPDIDLYVPNIMKTNYETSITNIYNSSNMALTGIVPATYSEMEMCRTKCRSKSNPTTSDYELYVGKGSASMAAFECYMRNFGQDEYVVNTPSNIFVSHRRTFMATFSFPCNNSDEKVSEVWAAGASTMAVFPGAAPFSTPVEILNFKKKDNRGYATVEFPKSANDFLTSWNTVVTSKETIAYGPLDGSDDIAYQAIREGFGKLMGSNIFYQYVAAAVPKRTGQKLSDEQKKMKGISLDKFQSEALETILYSNGISLTQAPPGSGKTALVAAVTREFLKSKEAKTIVITGTTNIAVDNALSTLSGIADDSLDLRPIRFASQRAICQALDMEKELSRNDKAMKFEKYISSEASRTELTRLRGRAEGLTEAAKAGAESSKLVVDKFVTAKNAVAKLEETFTDMFRPNVIGTTTSLLLRNSTKSTFKDTTHILIDEASQLVPTELLAILAAFPNLKKIAIIGDEYQLEPYSQLPEDSNARNCFGTPDLVRLNKEFGDAATKLKRVYRSHPQMTLNLINAFYPYQLEAGAKAENRDMAQRLDLPICSDGTPVRAYHVDGKEFKGKNEEEAAAIVEFVKNIINKGAKHEDILVLTFHRNQRSLLSTKLPNEVRVKTVDSAQGQQSAITIVATTKTSQSDYPRAVVGTLQFIANENRGTVALSRGLEATYIFGNLPQLEMTKFWDPIIKSIRSRNGTSNEPSKKVFNGNSSFSNQPANRGKYNSKPNPKNNNNRQSNNWQQKKNGKKFVKPTKNNNPSNIS